MPTMKGVEVSSGPVTEIALLRLKQPLSAPTAVPPSILKNLAHAATQQQKHSGFPVTMFHCVKENGQLIYLVGGWRSASAHMNEWIPGEVNQELMKLLSPDVDVEWMFHLDVDPAQVNAVLSRAEQVGGDDGAGVVAFGRYTVRDDAREEFRTTFDANRTALDEFIGGEQNVIGAWRLDQGFDTANTEAAAGDREVAASVAADFVLLTIWSNAERHLQFAETEGFKERFSKIRPFVDTFDVKHCQRLELS